MMGGGREGVGRGVLRKLQSYNYVEIRVAKRSKGNNEFSGKEVQRKQ